MALLVIVTIPTTELMVQAERSTGTIRNDVVAANLVEQSLGTARSEPFSLLISQAVPNGAALTTTQTVGQIPYTVKLLTRWQATSATSGACDNPANGTNGTSAVLFVEASVSWTGALTPLPTADTIIAPPSTYFSNAPDDGNLALTVTGSPTSTSPAPPQFNVPVTVTGPNGGTYTTDANGCLFLAYLAPGSYTISLNTAGWSDTQENTISTETVTLVANQTTTASMSYDLGGTLTTTLTGATPAPIGLPVTITNSGLFTGTDTVTGGIGGTTVITPLWAYANGYQAYAGRCPEANPAAQGASGPLYTGAPTLPTAAVTRGGSATLPVTLYPFTVVLTSTSHASVAGWSVTVTEQAATGYATVACANLATYPLVGLTSATGTLTAGMPLGHFTVTATSGATSSSTSAQILPSAANTTASITVP